jgi:hypothetical protein
MTNEEAAMADSESSGKSDDTDEKPNLPEAGERRRTTVSRRLPGRPRRTRQEASHHARRTASDFTSCVSPKSRVSIRKEHIWERSRASPSRETPSGL